MVAKPGIPARLCNIWDMFVAASFYKCHLYFNPVFSILFYFILLLVSFLATSSRRARPGDRCPAYKKKASGPKPPSKLAGVMYDARHPGRRGRQQECCLSLMIHSEGTLLLRTNARPHPTTLRWLHPCLFFLPLSVVQGATISTVVLTQLTANTTDNNGWMLHW